MGTDGGQVCHAHRFAAVFVDDRQLALDGVVAGITQSQLLQEAAVDLVDQLQMARQQVAEQVQIPLLQGLRQQGVVGVGDRPGGDVPGFVPIHMAVVNQQSHQLRHGNGGVRVVELNGPVLGEVLDG